MQEIAQHLKSISVPFFKMRWIIPLTNKVYRSNSSVSRITRVKSESLESLPGSYSDITIFLIEIIEAVGLFSGIGLDQIL